MTAGDPAREMLGLLSGYWHSQVIALMFVLPGGRERTLAEYGASSRLRPSSASMRQSPMLAGVPRPPDPPPDPQAWGLCASCRHHRVVATDRGSRFVRCALSSVDPRYPRYPVVPVRRCPGYALPPPVGGTPVD